MSVTLFFVALKLAGYLGWALLVVLSPLWVPWAVPLAFAYVAFGVAIILGRIAEVADHE